MEKQAQKGDIVLYTEQFDTDMSESPNISPSLITRVHPNNLVDLTVFYLNGSFVKTNVPQGGDVERGTWHPRAGLSGF